MHSTQEEQKQFLWAAHPNQKFAAIITATSYVSPVECLKNITNQLAANGVKGIVVFDFLLAGNSRFQRFFHAEFDGVEFEKISPVREVSDRDIHAIAAAKLLSENFPKLNTILLTNAQRFAVEKGIPIALSRTASDQDISPSYIFADGHMHLDDDFIVVPESGISIEDYLHGRCEIFAMSLGRALNLEVGAIVQHEPLDDGPAYLVHAFCLHPTLDGFIIDARGIRSLEQIYDEYEEDEDFSGFHSGSVDEMKETLFSICKVDPEGGDHERQALLGLIMALNEMDFFELPKKSDK
jgi:hypothetical protein